MRGLPSQMPCTSVWATVCTGVCVTRAQHTQQELMAIAQELFDLPGSLGGGPEDDWVDFQVLYDDGSYQAWADTAYGAGTVVVTSALVDAG